MGQCQTGPEEAPLLQEHFLGLCNPLVLCCSEVSQNQAISHRSTSHGVWVLTGQHCLSRTHAGAHQFQMAVVSTFDRYKSSHCKWLPEFSSTKTSYSETARPWQEQRGNIAAEVNFRGKAFECRNSSALSLGNSPTN